MLSRVHISRGRQVCRRIFRKVNLKFLLILIFCLLFPLGAIAQPVGEALFELSGAMPALEPDGERRKVVMPEIDNEFVELGVHVGSMNVEDFGSSLSYGAKIAFHATDSFFLEARASVASVTDEPFRRYNLTLFGDRGRTDLYSYAVALGWNVLPGEVYLSRERSLNASAYVLGGAGSISFAGDDYFSVLVGMGLRVLPTDWLSIRVETVVTEYESTIFGYKKFSHNMEALLGVQVFF